MRKALIIAGVAVSAIVCAIDFAAWRRYQISWKTSVAVGVILVTWNTLLTIAARRIEMKGCKKTGGEWLLQPETKS